MAKVVEQAKIVKNIEIADGIFDMHLLTKKIAQQARCGQFVHIDCGGDTFLRRPISVCDTDGEVLRILYQVKGKGTAELARYQKGDVIDVLGPLGNWFTVKKENALLIGGGIGTYPLLKLARDLENPTALLGFRNKNLVTLEEDFRSVCHDTKIVTDDGSYGEKGLVTDFMGQIIEDKQIRIIYACGPKVMLQAVCRVAAEYGVKIQVSLEERMGCGIGACLVCSCKIKQKKGDGWEYKQVCKNGPIFWGDEVIFE